MDADIKVIHAVIANGQVLEPVGHDGIRAVIAADK
jgi:hypothetical protein